MIQNITDKVRDFSRTAKMLSAFAALTLPSCVAPLALDPSHSILNNNTPGGILGNALGYPNGFGQPSINDLFRNKAYPNGGGGFLNQGYLNGGGGGYYNKAYPNGGPACSPRAIHRGGGNYPKTQQQIDREMYPNP